jgi:hypothetical protein
LILKFYYYLYLQNYKYHFVAHLYSTGFSPRRSGFDPWFRFHISPAMLLVCRDLCSMPGNLLRTLTKKLVVRMSGSAFVKKCRHSKHS